MKARSDYLAGFQASYLVHYYVRAAVKLLRDTSAQCRRLFQAIPSPST